jgi:hypothetical protein
MIWIDVDCVVADFLGHIEKTAGVRFENTFPFEELDLEVARLRGRSDWTWRAIAWNEIPVTPWAYELMKMVRGSEIGFLTACIHQDRALWLKWFARVMHVSFAPMVFTEHKSSVVRKEDELIDDRDIATIRVPAQWWYPNWSVECVMPYVREQFNSRIG